VPAHQKNGGGPGVRLRIEEMSRPTASDEARWREAFERLGTHTVRSRLGTVEISFDAPVPDIVQTEPLPPRWFVKGWLHEKDLADARSDDRRHTHRHRVLIAIAVLTVMSILAWPLIKPWFPGW
jgi:hypothetical protein